MNAASGRLAGKTAIVTGGARGLGRAIAARFVAEGARVFLTDIDPAVRETAREIGGVDGLIHDVTDESNWQAVIDRVADAGTPLDILVNNAGIARLPDGNELESFAPATWRRIVEVNGLGTALGCKLGFLAMRDRGGVILNLASIAATEPGPTIVAYGYSKAGVVHLSRSTAQLGAPFGVRCNSIHPGMIRTPMLRDIQDAQGDAGGEVFLSGIPMGAYQTEEDIAAGALFLASDEARFITGTHLVIDGGLTL